MKITFLSLNTIAGSNVYYFIYRHSGMQVYNLYNFGKALRKDELKKSIVTTPPPVAYCHCA